MIALAVGEGDHVEDGEEANGGDHAPDEAMGAQVEWAGPDTGARDFVGGFVLFVEKVLHASAFNEERVLRVVPTRHQFRVDAQRLVVAGLGVKEVWVSHFVRCLLFFFIWSFKNTACVVQELAIWF